MPLGDIWDLQQKPAALSPGFGHLGRCKVCASSGRSLTSLSVIDLVAIWVRMWVTQLSIAHRSRLKANLEAGDVGF
jgi:hypothetical protein